MEVGWIFPRARQPVLYSAFPLTEANSQLARCCRNQDLVGQGTADRDKRRRDQAVVDLGPGWHCGLNKQASSWQVQRENEGSPGVMGGAGSTVLARFKGATCMCCMLGRVHVSNRGTAGFSGSLIYFCHGILFTKMDKAKGSSDYRFVCCCTCASSHGMVRFLSSLYDIALSAGRQHCP